MASSALVIWRVAVTGRSSLLVKFSIFFKECNNCLKFFYKWGLKSYFFKRSRKLILEKPRAVSTFNAFEITEFGSEVVLLSFKPLVAEAWSIILVLGVLVLFEF